MTKKRSEANAHASGYIEYLREKVRNASQGWNPVTLFGKGDGQRAFASGENSC